MRTSLRVLLVTCVFLAGLGAANPSTSRYALILTEPSVTEHFGNRQSYTPASAASHEQALVRAQDTLRRELVRRNVAVRGAVHTLMNAVFVEASADSLEELRALPGVQFVVPLKRNYPKLNRAVNLVNAPGAWAVLGGIPNAGTGSKIAILDSGIDQNHAAFKNSNLSVPAGFPKCSGANCAYTNNKVIVARTYVSLLTPGTGDNPAATSRPDDTSPRDRVGHGTALAMVSGGQTNTGPSATITGMAPQAWLGNYKIFGSPGVNDFANDDAIVTALDDAVRDGMDVAVLSLGGPAFSGPLDVGAACGNTGNAPCDLEVLAIERASQAGMLVVAAAGNEGLNGLASLADDAFNTIDSPGYAPSAIAVGAITNAHIWISSLLVPGSDTPANIQSVAAEFGDGPMPSGPLTAPARDAALGGDATACRGLAKNSLTGTFALVARGSCNFTTKLQNAQDAGAIGVIFYLVSNVAIFPPSGLTGTSIPALLINNSDGIALKNFIASHPDHLVTLDPTPREQYNAAYAYALTDFSSRGPSTDSTIKPDMLAVGTDMYMATQSFDPNGEMYSANGYTVADGTSFATPMVAGAAALVKQKHPTWTPAQIKSALVDTGTTTGLTDLSNNPVGVDQIGGGLLNTVNAVNTTVTAAPVSLSFGTFGTNSSNTSQALTFTNGGTSGVTLTLTAVANGTTGGNQVQLDKNSLSISAGQTATVNVTLSGGAPNPGAYDGVVNVSGGPVPLHIPYLYLKGDGNPYNIISLAGDGFNGTVGGPTDQGIIAFKVVDRYGIPVAGVPVTFSVQQGNGSITNADAVTDQFGIAGATPILGSTPGDETFEGNAGGLTVDFFGTARVQPAIAASGIVNSASFALNQPVAPGSYITIFGNFLSDSTAGATTSVLPLSLDSVVVSFDVPSAGISVLGHLVYVSATQINVQVPWELAGQTSALVKVRVQESFGALYTLPLAAVSPAFFEIPNNGSTIAAALDQGSKLINSSNPAKRGQLVELFANGLGAVSNTPESGFPSPSAEPLSRTLTTPTVTIGGVPAVVSYSGLAPGFPGLDQINVTVASNTPSGLQPVVITINGVASKASSIPVQ